MATAPADPKGEVSERDPVGDRPRLKWYVSAAVMTLAAFAVAADRSRGPQWFQDLAAEFEPGVPSLVALIALLLVARWVYLLRWSPLGRKQRTPELRLQPLRAALFPLALVAGVMAVAELPHVVDGGGRSSSVAWAYVLLGLLLAIVIGKLLLLQHLAGRARSRMALENDLRLLPSQEQDLRRLCQSIAAPPSTSGHLIQLVGRWGDAKSYLLHRLQAYWDVNARPTISNDALAVVLVDVWKHEAEPDLHLAILEEILSDPAYLRDWFLYPVSVLVGRYLRRPDRLARRRTSAATDGDDPRVRLGKNPELDVPVRLPRLLWQHSLERLADRRRRHGCRTVIVLDEIDRASPEMAQVTATLTRRSLDLPGIIVVLAFVEPLIMYKAFNPLMDRRLPDLHSTMEAVIFEEAFERQRSALDEPKGSSVHSWWATQAGRTLQPPGPSASGSDADQIDLATWLRLGYAGASAGTRRRLQDRFSEKFLGRRPIVLQPLQNRDVGSILQNFDDLQLLMQNLDVSVTVVQDQVTLVLDEWARQGRVEQPAPPVRALAGEIFRWLSHLEVSADMRPVPTDLVVASVVAAYDSAWLKNAVHQ